MKPQLTPEEFTEMVRDQFNLYETLADMLRPENEETEYTDEINY